MEIFADIPEYWQRIDYALMQNGPMNLYYRNEILDSDIDSLKGLGYLIEIFDCSKSSLTSFIRGHTAIY